MKIKNRGWFSRGLALLLALTMLLSVGVVTAFAEGEPDDSTSETAALKPGIYTFPLIRQKLFNDTTELTTSPLQFSAQAILKVDNEGNQEITIGVNNWSFYDAFIPRKQEFADKAVGLLPDEVFNDDNSSYFAHFDDYCQSNLRLIKSTPNSWFNFGTADKKFGNISFEESNVDDQAYVTFDIDDYRKTIVIYCWFNTPYSSETGKYNEYVDRIAFHLNTNMVTDVTSIYYGINNSTGFFIRTATQREDTQSSNAPMRFNVSFSGDSVASSVFDEVSTESNADGSITAKYHVNLSQNQYTDFKCISSINHPKERTLYNWDPLQDGVMDELSLENGTISMTYNSIEEALLGKRIYFDVDTSDNYLYFCSPCLSPMQNEEFKIIDAEGSGIYIETDTASLSKNTQIKGLFPKTRG